MRNFLERLSYKIQIFMQGRHGYDSFSKFLGWVTIILLLIASLFSVSVPWADRLIRFFALFAFIFSVYRCFSKDLYRRQKELDKYESLKNRTVDWFGYLKDRWKYRKTHVYYKCPECGFHVRISKPPKGKTIEIRCPRCQKSFRKHT